MAIFKRLRALETLRWIPVFTNGFSSFFSSSELNWAAIDHAARMFHARRLMGNSSLWNTYVCVSAKIKKWYSAPRVHMKTRSQGAQAQL